jgi:histidinol-phosphate aminotransferase
VTGLPAGTGVRVRAALAAMPSYVPGRKAPGAVPLASNESPYGLLPGVAEVLAALAPATSRYPDLAAVDLRAALAERHDVEPEGIAVGAGSVEVLGQVVSAVVEAGDDVVFAWRSFEAYPIATAVAGGRAVRVPLSSGHVHDLEAMAAALTPATRLVLVCNANNPTSTAVGATSLRRFVDSVPTDVLVVVDEAYREYADPAAVPDALELFGDRPNVLVLRTFSKAYALAGLRVGYCVGSPDVVRAVRTCQVPFSVSALAQAAAVAALGQQREVARRAALTVAERDRVAAALRVAGFDVPTSQANFVWLPLGERSTAFAEHCAARGVLVRPFPGDGVRVTTGLPEENDALLAAATSS